MATGNLSTGQIIGGFIGGVIGAYFGGPWGAVLGASIGMTIGGWIDPPDIDYEKPDKSDLSLNKADEAIPLPDVLGTTKLGGNVIAYWGNWADAQKQRVEGGGKGGSESITTGYKYYLTWEVGVAEGPVETFQTMFKNNDMLWYNGMTAPDQGLGDNIWLRYKFDDKSSSSTDDAGPYDADGILTGSPPFTSGKSGGAKIFNGSSQNLTVDMPSNFGDVFRDEFSIAFWYKNPNIYHGKSVFWTRRREYVGYWKVMDQIEISFYSNQCNVVYKCNGALQSGWLRVYNVLVADGNWHHLVFSFNSDYIKGYKDGVLASTDPSHDGWMYNQNMDDFGRNPDAMYVARGYSSTTRMGITLDEFQIYDKALDIYEVGDIYGNPALVLQGQCGVIEDYGRFCLYYGTNIQEKPTTVEGIADHEKLMAYRGLAYVHFEDFYIGEYNAAPTMTFVVTKRPDTALDTADKNMGNYGYNPVHAIYYLMIKCGVSSYWIDEDNFNEVAGYFKNPANPAIPAHTLGVNLYMGSNQTALGYIEGILARTNSILYYDHSGKFKIMCLDKDIAPIPDTEDMITLNEDDMLTAPQIETGTWTDTYNEVKVAYFGRMWNSGNTYIDYADAIQTSMDMANMEIQGRVNSKQYNFGGIDNATEAARVAARELLNLTIPRKSIKVKVDRDAFKLQVGDSFILNYSPYNIDGSVYLIGNIQEETVMSEGLDITAVEDMRFISTTVSGEGLDREIPDAEGNVVPLTMIDVIEAPYSFSGDDINVIPLVHRKLGWETGYYTYYSNDGSSYEYLEDIATYTIGGTLTQEYSADTKTIDDDSNITFVAELDNDMSGIETTTRSNLYNDTHLTLLKGENGEQEFISWETITPLGSETYKLEGIVRGKHDTNPTTFSGGSKVYFIYNGYTLLEHAEMFSGTTRYFKFVPYNAGDQGSLSEATAVSIDLVGRAAESYTPYSFMANEMAHHPTYSTDIDLTWTDRWRSQNKGPGAGYGNADTVVDTSDDTETTYSIDFTTGPGGTHNYTTTGNSYTYPAATISSDHGGTYDMTITISGYITYNSVNFYSEQRTINVEYV